MSKTDAKATSTKTASAKTASAKTASILSFKQNDLVTMQKKIGYTFKDIKLLERAFTHSSVDKDATKNYQSLEFLGDSILDFVVAKRLMEINPDAHEGSLTKLRASIVSKEPLAEEIKRLDLAKYLVVGKGENAEQISSTTKIMSDIFEAVIAAIYLDSGRIEDAEKFVLSKLAHMFNGACKHTLAPDHKTELNEYASRHDLKIEYVQVSKSGKPHEPVFDCKVRINGLDSGRGKGRSKKDAEQLAAKQALEHINKNQK